MKPIFCYVLSAVLAYFIGSFSFGIIISKLFYKKDIRDFGSHNAGMTNMMRTFGKGPGIAVFLLDVFKGVLAVLLAKMLFSDFSDSLICGYIAALFAIIGHMYPIYFNFKGGKGVATALGVTTFLAWQTLPVIMIPFIATAVLSKMVSLASIISAFILPFATCLIYKLWYPEFSPLVPTVVTAIIGVIIIVFHRSNIKRIINGEENRIGKSKKK